MHTNKRNRVCELAKEQEGFKVIKSGRNLYNYIVILKSKELLFLLRKKLDVIATLGIVLFCLSVAMEKHYQKQFKRKIKHLFGSQAAVYH